MGSVRKFMLLIHRNVIFYCIDITIMLPIHIQVSLYLDFIFCFLMRVFFSFQFAGGNAEEERFDEIGMQ